MVIKQIKATETPTFREFRILDSYNEWVLYRIRKADERWSLTKPSAGTEIFLSSHVSAKQAVEAAKLHVNTK
jgi:hypothetical protein